MRFIFPGFGTTTRALGNIGYIVRLRPRGWSLSKDSPDPYFRVQDKSSRQDAIFVKNRLMIVSSLRNFLSHNRDITV